MTLIEITIAVVIIGIVSSYAFAQAAAYSDKAKYSRAVELCAAHSREFIREQFTQ